MPEKCKQLMLTCYASGIPLLHFPAWKMKSLMTTHQEKIFLPGENLASLYTQLAVCGPVVQKQNVA